MFIREMIITSPAILKLFQEESRGKVRGGPAPSSAGLPRGRLGGLVPEARVIYALGQREPGQPQGTDHSMGKRESMGLLGRVCKTPHKSRPGTVLAQDPREALTQNNPHDPFTRRKGESRSTCEDPGGRTPEGKQQMHPCGT